MPLVDPAQDMSCGRWTLANGTLAGTGDDPNAFRTGEPDTKYALFFPYVPPAEYEMRVSFTPQVGQANPEVEFLLQCNQGAFQFRIPMADPIAPGRPHQVVVRVRGEFFQPPRSMDVRSL